MLGCAAPAEVDGEPRIAGLIEALGDHDLEVRTLAGIELRRLGPLAEPELRENARHRDVEVAARCAELLGKLDPRIGDAGATLARHQINGATNEGLPPRRMGWGHDITTAPRGRAR